MGTGNPWMAAICRPVSEHVQRSAASARLRTSRATEVHASLTTEHRSPLARSPLCLFASSERCLSWRFSDARRTEPTHPWLAIPTLKITSPTTTHPVSTEALHLRNIGLRKSTRASRVAALASALRRLYRRILFARSDYVAGEFGLRRERFLVHGNRTAGRMPLGMISTDTDISTSLFLPFCPRLDTENCILETCNLFSEDQDATAANGLISTLM